MIPLTPKDHAKYLCLTCDEAFIRETARDRIVVCNFLYHDPTVIKQPVLRCSGYRDKTQPAQHQLEKIAWTLDPNAKGREAGFQPPKKKGDDD